MKAYELIEFEVDDDTYTFQIRCPIKSQAQLLGLSKIFKDILDSEYPEFSGDTKCIGFKHPEDKHEEETDVLLHGDGNDSPN